MHEDQMRKNMRKKAVHHLRNFTILAVVDLFSYEQVSLRRFQNCLYSWVISIKLIITH